MSGKVGTYPAIADVDVTGDEAWAVKVANGVTQRITASQIAALATANGAAADDLSNVSDADILAQGGAAGLLPRADLGAQDFTATGSTASRDLAERLGVPGRVYLADFITDATIRANYLAGTNTAALDAHMTAALAALPASGGDLIVHPVTHYFASPITIGNGTSTARSSRVGVRLLAEGPLGMDEGVYATPRQAARFLYNGTAAPTSYFLTLAGPIWGVHVKGIVLDCNGLCGFGLDMAHTIECEVDVRVTKYSRGIGRMYVHSVASLPSGVTRGCMDNKVRIIGRVPWESGAIKRTAAGFRLVGDWTYGQGCSRNEIMSGSEFAISGDAGTFGLCFDGADNNRAPYVFTSFADGAGPGGSNLGYGVRFQGNTTGPYAGGFPADNAVAGAIVGSMEVVDQSGSALTTIGDNTVTFYATSDNEAVPAHRHIKVATANGRLANGWYGAAVPWSGRSKASTGLTSSALYFTPLGIGDGAASRFDEEMHIGRGAELASFSVHLDAAPGVGKTRTFTVISNGSATSLTLTFSNTESGRKTIALTTAVQVVASAGIVIKSESTGTPAAASAIWSLDVEPT